MFRLKAATRDLVKACGGLVRAGSVCGFSKTEVGRWQAVAEADLIPLVAIVRLEADCGLPIVTAALAELQGHTLTPTDGGLECGSVFAAHAKVLGAVGAVASHIAEAAADGIVTPGEAEAIDRDVGRLDQATAELRLGLAAARRPALRSVGG
jgi:hypothetical protein